MNNNWTEIITGNETAPQTGIYVIACRYDNHIGFEIYKMKEGDRFFDLYEGDNSHSDGYYPIDCLSYYIIPNYCDNSRDWSYIKTNHYNISIFAIQAKDSIEYAIAYEGWGRGMPFEILKQELIESICRDRERGIRDYGFTGTETNHFNGPWMEVVAGMNIPAYTPDMLVKHFELIDKNK
ncbi:MAG: hypothetical protein J6I49_05030 [Bacteroidales bacterium]|nr:hypothetical protein [Bacteroidales bacterium]